MLSRRFVSIRTWFVTCVLAVTVVLGASVAYVAYRYETQSARADMRRKGELLGDILAEQIADEVLVNDLAAINRAIDNVKQGDKDVLYIVVSGKNGEPIGHTFGGNRIPRYLAAVAPVAQTRFFVDKTRNLHIQHITVPLMGGQIGSVAIGLDECDTQSRGRRIVLAIISIFVLLFVPAVVLMVVLSQFVTHPILDIVNGLNQFTPGQVLPRVRVVFNDEIRLLAEGFARMVERINALHMKSKETQLKMIETEKLSSVGILASGIAHEINNPVAGIELCGLRLQKHAALGKQEREYAEAIIEASRQIQSITGRLLDYVRRPELREEMVDVRDILDSAVRLVQSRLDRNKIRLDTEYPPQPVVLRAVAAQLTQVFLNILLNAIDAVERDGRIRLGVSHGKGALVVCIDDNGCGVTPEVKAHAFDPFFSTKRNKGTGLGLYVCYTILKEHNGSIALESLPAGGARVRIVLPAEEKA